LRHAWKRYLAFTDKGGTCTFEQLVHGAGLKVPYDEGCIREIGEKIFDYQRLISDDDPGEIKIIRPDQFL